MVHLRVRAERSRGKPRIPEFWMWCTAHRLELAFHDALKATVTAFDTVDDLLLKLYCLYEKSPKKCIVSDLKECFSFDDNGLKPVTCR